jgi:radical SAM superfamily enzyme YgiQ (UPF0313 family)
MKVMLIRPRPHKNSLGLMDLMTCEPLELEYVSALLKKLGHDVCLKDMILERKTLDYFVRQENPNVVMFTSYITHVNIIKRYADIVKSIDNQIITVVGGLHTEVLPNDFTHPNIDYILGINGMENIEILMEALSEGRGEPNFKHDSINFDYALPMPDRNITAPYRHQYDYAFHVPCALLKTSLGCPFNCRFCFCREITRHAYIPLALEKVIAELKEIKEPNVFIVDDNFLVSTERIADFCRLLDDNNIQKQFMIFGRADFIASHEKDIALLAKHGLDAVFVGIESFKQSDLDNFNKKTEVEISEKAAAVLHKCGVDLYAGIIVGPDWDKNDFKQFTKWIKGIEVRFINLQPLLPFPGTEFYEDYKEQLLLKREDYEQWDMTHLAIMPTKLTPSRYYFEIIRCYFKTTLSWKSVAYIYRKSGIKSTIKCLSLNMLFHYIKLMWKYRKIKLS